MNSPDGPRLQVLFKPEKPADNREDWIESYEGDDQLMLLVSFHSKLKLQYIQITSRDPDMRPRAIKLFNGPTNTLPFDTDMTATQEIEIPEGKWNEEGTADIQLQSVRFKDVTSLVIFVNPEGEEGTVRIDRLKFIGEVGEKLEMGKLEKFGDEPGE